MSHDELKMADEAEEQIFTLACSCVILSSVLLSYAVQKQKRHHAVWVRGYLKDLQRYGAYNRLMNDLQGSRSLWDRGDTSPPIFGLGGTLKGAGSGMAGMAAAIPIQNLVWRRHANQK